MKLLDTTTLGVGIALASCMAFAGRPLMIDDADPVSTGHAEFEGGVGYGHETITMDIAGGSRIHGDTPDFTATAGITVGLGWNKRTQTR